MPERSTAFALRSLKSYVPYALPRREVNEQSPWMPFVNTASGIYDRSAGVSGNRAPERRDRIVNYRRAPPPDSGLSRRDKAPQPNRDWALPYGCKGSATISLTLSRY